MISFARLSVSLGVAIALSGSGVSASTAQEMVATEVAPAQVRTVAQSRCGPPTRSTAGTNCQGFDGRQIREQSDIFVVGYENNAELSEKHVLQTVVVFDLSALMAARPTPEVTRASLHYAEASTTRRSAAGDSEYGVLPSCNTRLGVPTGSWDGDLERLIPTRPAATAGAVSATTGDAGSWDVTPQVKLWLAAGQPQVTLVMSGEDESLEIKAQALCLSYIIDLGLSVEQTTRP
ncbi:MAG: hypothetical protein ACKVVP_08595 [Chloroflexota bacterium]